MFSRFISMLKIVHFRHLIPDSLVIVASLYLALYLRVGEDPEWPIYLARLHASVPLILAIRLFFLFLTGGYTVLWRYVSARDAYRLSQAVFASSLVIIALSFYNSTDFARFPRSIYLIDSVLVLMGLMGLRLRRRLGWEFKDKGQIRHGKRTLIYGAGYNGKMLANRFGFDAKQATHLLGFIDDDKRKLGLKINDVKVLGSREDLGRLIGNLKVSQVIIAATSIPGEVVREIVQVCRPFNIRPRIISRSKVGSEDDQYVDVDREVNLADLLNRPARDVEVSDLKKMIRGKKVLVTGAGGSIGSEISRQVIELEPGRLMLLDHSEYNLYEIDRELRLSCQEVDRVQPLLADLKSETAALGIKEFAPEIVFHAAAYKHVHLVEANAYSAILNNVKGTKKLLDAARSVGTEVFVNISTDKAVNPAGVMGATKRVSELLTTSMAMVTGKKYCSVRFGNVLGSSGSLIPLLKKQIKGGGPVTITHEDMTRYFMTTPEAVSLVLKAATIARPGDINVLKMGEPVKILDVAKSMIALMGRTEKQAPIVFTGLRPGEKIYEELYIRGDELKTEHPDILTLPNGDLDRESSSKKSDVDFAEEMFDRIDRMSSLAESGQRDALYELNTLVKSSYVPPENIKDESSKVTYLITPHDKSRTH